MQTPREIMSFHELEDHGRASALRNALIGTTSRRLRGYGEARDAPVNLLDPDMEQRVARLMAITEADFGAVTG